MRVRVNLIRLEPREPTTVGLVAPKRPKSTADAYLLVWLRNTPQVITCDCGCVRLRSRIPLGWVGHGRDWTCPDCRRDATMAARES